MLKMNRSFYATCLLFITIGLASVLLFSKEASSLLINGSHTPLAGLFFTYYTYFGDFEALLLLTVISLFISYRQTAIIAMSALITTIIAQSLKHILAHPRPSAILTTDQGFHIVPGIDLHTALSFSIRSYNHCFQCFYSISPIYKKQEIRVPLGFDGHLGRIFPNLLRPTLFAGYSHGSPYWHYSYQLLLLVGLQP